MVAICCLVRKGDYFNYFIAFIEALLSNVVVIASFFALLTGVDPVFMYIAISHLIFLALSTLYNIYRAPNYVCSVSSGSTTTGGVTTTTSSVYIEMNENKQENECDDCGKMYKENWCMIMMKVLCIAADIIIFINPTLSPM